MSFLVAFTLEVAVLFAMMWVVIRVRERHAGNIDGLMVSAIAICVMVAVIATMVRDLDRGPHQTAQHSQFATIR